MVNMELMYARILKNPESSTLLLGPRGTGKSTWIQQNFPQAILYDLLNQEEALRLSKNPSLLFQELQSQSPKTWVVIDEVQKVPALLDEVHRLIEQKGLRFILSGSSARKLKRGSANLLAGRALTQHFYPLSAAEVNFNISFPNFFTQGMLPMAYTSQDPLPYLKSYVDTYLKEEIQTEALTKNLGGFGRFLEIAARQNGQVTNVSSIARDAMVERKTVENYFQILIDTLIGHWLPPWKLKRGNKQITHPKFYFFDAGVARALSGRLPYPATQEELGFLMETSLLSEIRAYLSYHSLYYELYFWKNHYGTEVDLLLETNQGFVALEIKATSQWQRKFHRGFKKIQELLGAEKVTYYGIYQGQRQAQFEDVSILPTLDFLQKLWQGEIIR